MVDVQTIQKLRQQTGAGMVDCKKALEEAQDDFDKAIEILRKKGEVKAAKKAERETKEGLISIAREGKKIAVVALACETDFVSRNESFINACDEFSQKLLNADNIDEFKNWADAKIKNELVVKIGENIKLADAQIFENDIIGQYLHSNKKVAAVVLLKNGNEELANDLAMQVVAMSPDYIKPEEVPTDILEKEKEIYREQLKKEGKPAEIVEKILMGKVNKFYEEVCLLKQDFIKDDKKKVEDYIKEQGEGIEVLKFVKFAL